MVAEDLFIIISKMPERISKYVSDLRLFTSNFLFFSDIPSFLKRALPVDIKLLILDSVGGDASVVEQVRSLRHLSACEVGVILVIVQAGENENGVAALSAGADDYLTYPLVNKELAVRTRMHLNKDDAQDIIVDFDIDLKNIYPREDRFILRTALYYIKNNIATIKRASDLFVCLGKSDREINKVFTRHLNMTASEYIRDFRVGTAKDLLLKTRIPITQIADSVGYSSSANFSTAFKNIVGQSPREFRSQDMLIE